jgi:hypothetical protein
VALQAGQFLKDVQSKQLKHIFFAARRTDATVIKTNKKLKRKINNRSHKSKIKNNKLPVKTSNKIIRK